jgi:TonB family protein
MSSVYAKSQLGVSAIQASRESLNPTARRLLILIDGHRDVEELSVMLGPEAVRQHLPFLVNEGYVWPVQASAMGVVQVSPTVHGAGALTAKAAPAAPEESPASPGRLSLAARIGGLLVVLGAGAGIWWWYTHATSPGGEDSGASQASAAPAPLPQPITISPAAPLAVVVTGPEANRAAERVADPRAALRSDLARADAAKARKGERSIESPVATPVPAPTSLSPPDSAAAPVPAPMVAAPAPAAPIPAPPAPETNAPAQIAAAASSAATPGIAPGAASSAAPGNAPARTAAPAGPPPLAAATPPAAPAATAPVNLRVRNRVLPELPRRAKRMGIDHGEVLARLHINATGTVDKVELVRADPPQVYDDQVQRTLAQWTFEPPGQAVVKNIELSFKP